MSMLRQWSSSGVVFSWIPSHLSDIYLLLLSSLQLFNRNHHVVSSILCNVKLNRRCSLCNGRRQITGGLLYKSEVRQFELHCKHQMLLCWKPWKRRETSEGQELFLSPNTQIYSGTISPSTLHATSPASDGGGDGNWSITAEHVCNLEGP